MKQVKAKYVLGLTAIPERKDGHHPIIYMQCGPIRYKLSARSTTAASPFEHEIIARLTELCLPPEGADTTIQELYAAFADDNSRNELIVCDLLRMVQDGCSPLLLTVRTEHLRCFEAARAANTENVFVLKGDGEEATAFDSRGDYRGTASLYQRKGSTVSWIKYHRNGRSFRESTRTTDKRKASRALAKRLAEINTGSFVGHVYERITVGELAEDLFRDYRINVRKTTSYVQTRWRLHLEPFLHRDGLLRSQATWLRST
jgi:hypothetical protein